METAGAAVSLWDPALTEVFSFLMDQDGPNAQMGGWGAAGTWTETWHAGQGQRSLLLRAPSGQGKDFRVEMMGQLCPLQAEFRCPRRVGEGQQVR